MHYSIRNNVTLDKMNVFLGSDMQLVQCLVLCIKCYSKITIIARVCEF